jgi:hypothetical protein
LACRGTAVGDQEIEFPTFPNPKGTYKRKTRKGGAVLSSDYFLLVWGKVRVGSRVTWLLVTGES